MTADTFEALLLPNLQSVRRFVQMRLRSPDHADDILQQTLLRAFVHRDQLRVSSKFKSWLFSIAMNEVRVSFRSERTPLSLAELPNIAFHDSGPSPLARVENLERAEWLQTGIAKLSKRDREVIRLRDLDELNVAETAAACKSSVAATKSTHFRARRRLACALNRVCGTRTIERSEGPGDFQNSRASQ
jgi:RNA polymerase sigma-70 factor (ECF subfamily)